MVKKKIPFGVARTQPPIPGPNRRILCLPLVSSLSPRGAALVSKLKISSGTWTQAKVSSAAGYPLPHRFCLPFNMRGISKTAAERKPLIKGLVQELTQKTQVSESMKALCIELDNAPNKIPALESFQAVSLCRQVTFCVYMKVNPV